MERRGDEGRGVDFRFFWRKRGQVSKREGANAGGFEGGPRALI